jgi:hypothetical protein
MWPRSGILKTSKRETMIDFKRLISKNILLEAKIEDQKIEIENLKRLLRRNRNMLTRFMKINKSLSDTMIKLEKLDIPEVEEVLTNS